MEDIRIPVTIVTGFLGAGKTTLLNNIIRKYPEKKFAIIENEIGEIGIDGGLIIGATDNIFELSNGCICCSLNADFTDVIMRLLKQSDKFQHLLIETTGIADPNAVIESFLSSEFIQKRFRIDSVICLADAANMESMINSEPEGRKQIALADIILLNKIENIQALHLREVRDKIASLNPSASIHAVFHADIRDIGILDTYSYSGKGIEKATLSFSNPVFLQKGKAEKSPVLSASPKENVHDIQAIGISVPGSFNPGKFNQWMESYLFFNSREVFRIKGILSFKYTNKKQVFQAVSSSYVVEEGSEWDDQQRFCKLVFIGRSLVKEDLEWALHRLIENE